MKGEISCTLVLISDTHDSHQYLDSLPDGDVLIHAGDFTRRRFPAPDENEYRRFIEWFSKQKHRHKIIISGNRDQYMVMVSISKFVVRSVNKPK